MNPHKTHTKTNCLYMKSHKSQILPRFSKLFLYFFSQGDFSKIGAKFGFSGFSLFSCIGFLNLCSSLYIKIFLFFLSRKGIEVIYSYIFEQRYGIKNEPPQKKKSKPGLYIEKPQKPYFAPILGKSPQEKEYEKSFENRGKIWLLWLFEYRLFFFAGSFLIPSFLYNI